MLIDLSPRARKKLHCQRERLLMTDVAKCAVNLHTTQEILTWCDDADIVPGRLISAKQYQFTLTGINQIEQRLTQQGFSPLHTDFGQLNRAQAARVDANEKRGQLSPTAHLLLVAHTDKKWCQLFSQTFYPSPQCNIEVDVNALNIACYDTLVVVENRDSFNDWHKFSKPNVLGDALVVYRGDKTHSKACKTLRTRWLVEKPQAPMVYFGDLDLAAIRIALSGGYQGLLLPCDDWLTSHLIRQHYCDNQLRFRDKLYQHCPVGWRALLELMHVQQAGLRQQWMLQAQLTVYWQLDQLI